MCFDFLSDDSARSPNCNFYAFPYFGLSYVNILKAMHSVTLNGFHKGMAFFLCFSSNFFRKSTRECGKNKQTTKKKKNTVLHRGNAKCDSQEAFARGTIDDTIDEKQLIFNRPPSCSAAKKQTKDVHLSSSLLPLFRDCSPSLSPDK